jgi:hypothetical protein
MYFALIVFSVYGIAHRSCSCFWRFRFEATHQPAEPKRGGLVAISSPAASGGYVPPVITQHARPRLAHLGGLIGWLDCQPREPIRGGPGVMCAPPPSTTTTRRPSRAAAFSAQCPAVRQGTDTRAPV